MEKYFFLLVVSLFVGGCSSEKIKYYSFIQPPLKPTSEPVRYMNGTLGNIPELFKKAFMPHLKLSERRNIFNQINKQVTDQIGDENYSIIGEVVGGGNAKSNLEKLKKKMAEKAAKNGGMVLFFYDEGVDSQPFVYTTPARSYNYFSGNANTNYYPNSAQTNLYGSGYTIHHPSQTYSGTWYFPYAKALVLVYDSSIGNYRKRISNLSEDELKMFEERSKKIDLKSLSLSEFLMIYTEILDKVECKINPIKTSTRTSSSK
jgi:hypothetical protein